MISWSSGSQAAISLKTLSVHSSRGSMLPSSQYSSNVTPLPRLVAWHFLSWRGSKPAGMVSILLGRDFLRKVLFRRYEIQQRTPGEQDGSATGRVGRGRAGS
jgi:hypothetical protein